MAALHPMPSTNKLIHAAELQADLLGLMQRALADLHPPIQIYAALMMAATHVKTGSPRAIAGQNTPPDVARLISALSIWAANRTACGYAKAPIHSALTTSARIIEGHIDRGLLDCWGHPIFKGPQA